MRQVTATKFYAGMRKCFHVALITAFTLQSVVPAYAQAVQPAGSRGPSIDRAANGVPVVNIVPPNGAGVSHNQYERFDVEARGLILNNNPTLGVSQLGGLVQGNPNLNGSPASLIVNEVTSSQRSAINGALEVNGRAADVVVANPNGISLNGGSTINIPRATFATGTPQFNADGSLRELQVRGGEIEIGPNGFNAVGSRELDLVARSLSLNGDLVANDVNASLGAQDYNFVTKDGEPVDLGGARVVAVDSSEVGGMFAGRIKILALEADADVNAPSMTSLSGDIVILADGSVTLGDTASQGRVDVTSTRSSVSIKGANFAATDANVVAAESVSLESSAVLAAGGDVSVSAPTIEAKENAVLAAGTRSDGVFEASAGRLTLAARDRIFLSKGTISRAGERVGVATGLNFENQGNVLSDGLVAISSSGDLSNSGLILSDRVEVDVTGVFGNAALGRIEGSSALVLSVGAEIANAGELRGGQRITIAGESGGDLLTLSNSGSVISGGDLDVRTRDLSNTASGELVALSTLALSTTNFLNGGRIEAGGPLTLEASDTFVNETDGVISSLDELNASLASGVLSNSGIIASSGSLMLNAPTVSNALDAEISSLASVALSGDVLTNSGLISGGANSQLLFGDRAENVADGTLQVTAGLLELAAQVIDNFGLIASAQDLILSGETITNSRAAILAQNTLTIEGLQSGTRATLVRNEAGAIETFGGDLMIRADALENIGEADFTTTTTSVAHEFLQSPPPAFVINLPPSFYRPFIGDDVFEQLSDGGRTQTYVFIPHPDRLARFLVESGKTIDEVTPTDWRSIAPTNQATFITDDWTILVPDEARNAPVGADAIVIDQVDELNGPVEVASIATDGLGNILLDVGDLTNRFGTITSGNDLQIDADTIANEGRELNRSISVRLNYNNDTVRPLGWFRFGFAAGNPGPRLAQRQIIDTIPAVISAGGNLRADAAGPIENVGAPATDISELSFANTSSTVVAEVDLTAQQDRLAALGFNAALFDEADTASPFLLETRASFVDPAAFFGSEFFLTRLGIEPEEELRILGDAYFDTRLIREQILKRSGVRFIDPEISDDASQLKALIENAASVQEELGLIVGVPLTPAQIASLPNDIVWYVEVEFDGQRVLAPQLYITADTLSEAAGRAAAITAGRSLDLSASSILNDRGAIAARQDLVARAQDRITNIGGRIVGNQILLKADGGIESITETVQTGDGVDRVGAIISRRAEIAGGFIEIQSSDVALRGGSLTAANDLRIEADNLTISPIAVEMFERFAGEKSRGETYNRTLLIPQITVGGNADIDVAQAALIQAAAIKVNDDLSIRAGEILIESATAETRNSGVFYKTGFNKGQSEFEYITITQVPTVIDTGGSIELIAGVGNATIRASVIDTDGSATIVAEQGEVRFETAFDYAYSRKSKFGSSAVWQSSSDKGEESQTVVHTEINAANGLDVQARDGIVVQYRKGLDLDQTIDAFADVPGLAWMGELAAQRASLGIDDVEWEAITEQHNSWSESSQGLSGPASAVLAIAIALATQNLGAAIAGDLFAGGTALAGTAGSVANAGFTALVTQATTSAINNGGDLGAVFGDLTSSQFARSLATTLVVAGLTPQVASALDVPTGSTDFVGRLQENLARAGVSSVAETAINGQSFSDGLVENLSQAFVSSVGAEASETIGNTFTERGADDLFFKYVSHAALGCAIGAASGDCRSGAIGAAAGEITADQLAAGLIDAANSGGELSPEQALEWRDRGVDLARLAGGLAVALSGGDAEGVKVGAGTAENAAANNALPVLLVYAVAALAPVGGFFAVKDIADTITKADEAFDNAGGGEEGAKAALRVIGRKALIDAGLTVTGLGVVKYGGRALTSSAAYLIAKTNLRRSDAFRQAANGELLGSARTQLDDFAATFSGQRNPPATAIGAVDPQTGRIVTTTNGDIPTNIHPDLQRYADDLGGLGVRTSCGNVLGRCAEFRAANELLLANPNLRISDIEFTEAIRPRTGRPVPRCQNCIDVFGAE